MRTSKMLARAGDFGTNIGKYFNSSTGKYVPTTNGIIHNSKTGAHIVPAAPNP